MLRALLLCAVLLILTAPSVLAVSCWPCVTATCGSTSGWALNGSHHCDEIRFNRCVNNSCTSYAPYHDDCYVWCDWQDWVLRDEDDSVIDECVKAIVSSEFCVQ